MGTEQERINWFEKMVANYDDTIEGGTVWGQNFSCGEFSNKLMLRSAGLENPEKHTDFNYFNELFDGDFLKENGKINLPVYRAHTKTNGSKPSILQYFTCISWLKPI